MILFKDDILKMVHFILAIMNSRVMSHWCMVPRWQRRFLSP